MVLFFVDLLGVKARWARGGRSAAEEGFQQFWNLLAYAMRIEGADAISLGLIESDSAAIICSTPNVALKIARRLYMAAFLRTHPSEKQRLWLRGVIVPRTSPLPLRRGTKFRRHLKQVDLMIYSDDLLDAITIEKSGFKGMRILILESLITADVRSDFDFRVDDSSFSPFRKLRHSGYPSRIATEFCDYLWMAEVSDDEMRRLDRIMALRMRHASRDAEEALQAAATQVVFHEVTAIVGDLRGKNTRRATRSKRS